MKEFNAVSYFDMDDYESVIKQIKDMNYKLYYIDGRKVSTMEDFFCFIKDKLPLDPPFTGSTNYVNFNAFADSFGAGIDQSEYANVAIVFKDSEKFIKDDRFHVFIQCMEDLTENLMREDCYNYKLTTLKTFLFGTGEKFSKYCD